MNVSLGSPLLQLGKVSCRFQNGNLALSSKHLDSHVNFLCAGIVEVFLKLYVTSSV
jgi:hypothetical protein